MVLNTLRWTKKAAITTMTLVAAHDMGYMLSNVG